MTRGSYDRHASYLESVGKLRRAVHRAVALIGDTTRVKRRVRRWHRSGGRKPP